jgi:hypothetical protein
MVVWDSFQSMYLVQLLVKCPVHVDWKESQIGGVSQLCEYCCLGDIIVLFFGAGDEVYYMDFSIVG